MFIFHTYLPYLALSIAVTVWVARTLHKNGRTFLIDAFHGNDALADSVNHLLVVGFYLINFGWIVAALRTYQEVNTGRVLMELLSDKIGTVLIVLGIMHFLNIFIFSRMRRRALDRRPDAPPPIPPSGYLHPQVQPR
ncbi:MAG: hypothetical protein FJW38_10380 [Acidobacteria bacterium]|nr:hypothetical protein [Acidobacteriota bacterium]